jgi:hypothetical protein
MKIKISVILTLILFIFLSSCSPSNQSLEAALEATLLAMELTEPTAISTPTPTLTPTQTPTATHTPTPTETPTLTPTTYPLSLESVLEEIAIQEQDLIEFYNEIGVSTDGFVDGSIMVISPEVLDKDSFTTWGNLYPKRKELSVPSNVVNYNWKGFTTERDFKNGRMPLYLAMHTSLILVFNSPEEAQAFFESEINNMPGDFTISMKTIGDESIAFRGWLGGFAPIGGVIWRYQEVYCSFMTQLKFEVASESLITISQKIQERLMEALN